MSLLNVQRYEKHLRYYVLATEADGTEIDDPDLDLPMYVRLTAIQDDEQALKLFISKHLEACNKFAYPSTGKDAFFLLRHSLAYRAGLRALGVDEQKLPTWSVSLRELVEEITEPFLREILQALIQM